MDLRGTSRFDVVVIGAGPAGVVAALRAARLGASTALITRDEFGGMAATDGPVPVRTLAHAARLMREKRQLPRYGVLTTEPALDYGRLLERVREVEHDVRTHSLLRGELEQAGVTIHEHAGTTSFANPHTIVSEDATQLEADKLIICTGGAPRPLPVPGFELTSTHSDAWSLESFPATMVVIGAGATGVQLASIFNAFGSDVALVEVAPRILMTEDPEVAAVVGDALEESGISVIEGAGTISRFETCAAGVRAVLARDGAERGQEAAIAVVAVGWRASTEGLALGRAGVELDDRGFVRVDSQLRTTAEHIFAAGDVNGGVLIAHEAVREGNLAAYYAVAGRGPGPVAEVSPIGSFTDPEYASVGLTEENARKHHDVVVGIERLDSVTRAIIDGRTIGFCKVLADADSHAILGCHVVGERAVEIAQLAAVAMAAGMSVPQLAMFPFSFPTYADALGRAAVRAAEQLDARDAAGRVAESAQGIAVDAANR
jgi:pyruvate/2-oxoglutarate dehydrogenase complex dihydrolipoamide dehydrogenase (E3) component